MERVAILAANLSFTLTYFAQFSYGLAKLDPFERFEGISVWGYEQAYDNVSMASGEKQIAIQACVVHTEHLISRWENYWIDERVERTKPSDSTSVSQQIETPPPTVAEAFEKQFSKLEVHTPGPAPSILELGEDLAIDASQLIAAESLPPVPAVPLPTKTPVDISKLPPGVKFKTRPLSAQLFSGK